LKGMLLNLGANKATATAGGLEQLGRQGGAFGYAEITMSLGVLLSHEWEARPVEELLQEADLALYAAKLRAQLREGRWSKGHRQVSRPTC
jgi:GGDEF domain-containing protein